MKPNPPRITLITTGGTIEKVYDEQSGTMVNRRSIVGRMLGRLRLEDLHIEVVELLSKDSLDMTDEDRAKIVAAVRDAGGFVSPAGPKAPTGASGDGVVVLHGTDTLCLSAEEVLRAAGGRPLLPIVFTGAMRPFEMKRSDAVQNLTESIFAAAHLPPAVYCVAHGRALRFPGVYKDRVRGTFRPAASVDK